MDKINPDMQEYSEVRRSFQTKVKNKDFKDDCMLAVPFYLTSNSVILLPPATVNIQEEKDGMIENLQPNTGQ